MMSSFPSKIITFDKSSKAFILDVFDKVVGAEGLIVEKANREQRVLNLEGEEIKISEFAGVRKGSEVFIKSDIDSLIRLCDSLSG